MLLLSEVHTLGTIITIKYSVCQKRVHPAAVTHAFDSVPARGSATILADARY